MIDVFGHTIDFCYTNILQIIEILIGEEKYMHN